MLEADKIYVYVDYRLDTHEPFYVGKGKRARVNDYVNRNQKWKNIATKHSVRREVVFETDDDQTALREESRLIFELKTRDYLGGANMDDGGQGPNGYQHRLETRERLAVLSQNRMRTHRERMKASEKFKKMWAENRKRIMETHIRGEKHHKARATKDDVIAIRAEYEGGDFSARGSKSKFLKKWADRLGITGQAVHLIATRKTWQHIS